MERAIILSDTHLLSSLALDIIKFESRNKKVDRIVHLGDMIEDALKIQKEFPNIKVDAVAGNCDLNTEFRKKMLIDIGKKKFFITHGHEYGVKESLDNLIEISQIYKSYNVESTLFGHTHTPYNKKIDDILYFNPGTAGDHNSIRTYGIIEVNDEKIIANIFNIGKEIYAI